MPLVLGGSAVVAAAGATGGCQFNAGTTEFTLSQAAGTSAKKFTVSMWFKLGAAEISHSGSSVGLWGCGTGTGDGVSLVKRNTNDMGLETWDGSSNPKLVTSREFVDPAAWMHVVCSIDTTNVTAGDRLKIWINGVEQTVFDTDTTITQDSDIPGWSGSGDTMYIGNRILDGDAFFDGEISHVNVIDGTIYNASAFGETDETSGIWKIKVEPDVTYGTNGGFYKFESGALTTDSSGESNTLTQAGSPTETKDNPDNNFCTMNPLDNYYANQTFTEGNNTIKSDYEAPATSTLGMTAGKWYCEGKCILTTSGTDWQIGIVGDQTEGTGNDIGNHANSWGYRGSDGDYRNNYGNTSYGNTYTTGDIIGCAVDLDNNKLYFAKDNVWQDSGDPTSGATGTGAISIAAAADTPLGAYFVAAGGDSSANDYTWSLNFGNGYFGTTAVTSAVADGAGIGAFEYAPPTGYYAICTKNISTYG